MREKIITEILAGMADIITVEQLAELQRVLTYSIYNYEIKERETPVLRGKKEDDLLAVFIAAKRIEGCSEKSLKYYHSTISYMLKIVNKQVCQINTDDLRCYLADYQKERNSSKVTVDNMRRIFSSFFSWLEDEDYILKSPVRRIHKIKTDKTIKETLSDEGLELLRDVCEEIRDLAMIDLLTSTGMRVGELVRLNREDINFHERECVVFGKGGNERLVYFDARTKIHLLDYLNSRTDNNPALFVSLTMPYGRLMIGGIETRLREIGKRADLYKVHPHKFRRTLATRAIDKGMPIEQVQRLLGHVKIDTTMHYAMVNQVNVKNSHRKFIG
ncbi:site-specific tyrosine recombinase/integron integrase [Treponema sp. R6D11]